MRLAVATICPHVWHLGRWWSYEPFVLEMNIWGELFSELLMVAPVEDGPPPAAWSPYRASEGITVIPFKRNKGRGLVQARTSLSEIPKMVHAIASAASRADAFHVRCPGSIGMLASLLAPMLSKRRVAKYAGQWPAANQEEISNVLQKRLLRSRWWGAPVLVYGKWPDQPTQIVPFFTSVMNESQMARARTAELRDWTKRPLEVLFVGRLSEAKNVDVIIRAIEQLQGEAEAVRLRVVGDGPMRGALKSLAVSSKVGDRVIFQGAVQQAEVLDFYEQGAVLVLASQTEGWPKAIAEAMAFGLVCIGTNRGLVPQMLGEGRGLLVPPRDVKALTDALRSVLSDPRGAQQISERAAAWAQQFTLERFRDALRTELESAWKVRLGKTTERQGEKQKVESRKQKAGRDYGPLTTDHGTTSKGKQKVESRKQKSDRKAAESVSICAHLWVS